ncbi:MAG: hypothetical protein ACK55I_46585, partial [bacterium]
HLPHPEQVARKICEWLLKKDGTGGEAGPSHLHSLDTRASDEFGKVMGDQRGARKSQPGHDRSLYPDRLRRFLSGARGLLG